MPTYDYECQSCDATFEVFQSMSAPKLDKCPTCGSSVKRLIGAGAGLIFKGGGFYETDFKTKSGTKPKEESSAPAVSTPSATNESGKTKTEIVAKPATKSESKKSE
jgi:putative FmdB family regulatory protein